MAAPNFWDNAEAAKSTVGRLKSIKAVVDPMRKVIAASEDLAAMVELLAEGDDAHIRAELDEGLEALSTEVTGVELLTMLTALGVK